MAQAYKCDMCSALVDGNPRPSESNTVELTEEKHVCVAMFKVKDDDKKGRDAELCINCKIKTVKELLKTMEEWRSNEF